MSFLYTEPIIEELLEAASKINQQQVYDLAEDICRSRHVFLDGLGRSRLCAGAFAMRLVHLGLIGYMVGDVETPAITGDDLLIICTGSGTSQGLLSHAQEAKSAGARVVTITGFAQSPIAQIADGHILIAAPRKEDTDQKVSILPMGSLFEDTLMLLFENMVILLMNKMNETGETMFSRHANLE